jgi:hypothetical protein
VKHDPKIHAMHLESRLAHFLLRTVITFFVVSSKSRVFFCVHLVVVGSEAPIDTMFRRKYDFKG